MKDRKLDEQFNKYFDGVEVPANLQVDAKKYVKKPSESRVLPKFVKIASIAASFVLCLTVAIAIIVTSHGSFTAPEAPGDVQSPDNSGNNSAPSSPDASYSFYYDKDLEYVSVDPYTVSGGSAPLKFIEQLALSPNAQVTAKTAKFESGETAFVYAEVTFISSGRDDTKIYVEFTDGVYNELTKYYDGERIDYAGITFYLTEEVDEYGEPVRKVFTVKNGIKYYFYVASSDTTSYRKYLQLIYKSF